MSDSGEGAPRRNMNSGSGTPAHQPSNARIWDFSGFDTLNTKPSRSALADQEMYWCKNFMPLGRNNLRAMWDVGTAVYAQTGGKTIKSWNFFHITTVAQDAANQPGYEYLIVFTTDGGAGIVNLTTSTPVLTIAAGTFSTSIVAAVAQWGNKYLVIASQVSSGNGYWLFDGSLLYAAGGIGPLVVVNGGGNNYTSAPTITAYGGAGSGATFAATLLNGQVNTIAVTAVGSGYGVNDAVGLAFSGGGNSSQTAILTASITDGQVTGLGIVNAGAGYTSEATLTFNGGGGTGAEITPQVTGAIGSVTMTSNGSGYSGAVATAVGDGGTGSGATFSIVGNPSGGILSVAVVTPGSGYKSPVTINFSGGGTGAIAQTTVVNGIITGYLLVNTGSGYTSAPTVTVADANSNVAQASVSLMPFGVQGNSVETYTQRVWVADGDKIIYGGPGDPSDFNTANGAGAFLSTDSFLRQGFIKLLQSNGFLYLIADSSINAISTVSTSGNPPITTFSNQNVDPQTGTPWVQSVAAFSRSIIFVNSFGVQALYGGAIQKVSTPLDGILGNLSSISFAPSAAVATIFGVHVYMFLVPAVDPTTGTTENLLFLWDGKRWWAADQSPTLISIQSREVNSQLSAYGTDGTYIWPLFGSPSNAITKTVQSKLWVEPNYFVTKRWLRQCGVFQNYDSSNANIIVALDSENAQSQYAYSVAVPPTGTGTTVALQGCDGAGVMFGITLQTIGKDLAVISYGATGQDFIKQV